MPCRRQQGSPAAAATALAERLANVRSGLDALSDAAGRSSTVDLTRALEECARILAPARNLTHAVLSRGRDAYAPPALFDAERALGLVHDWAWWVLIDDDEGP